MNPHEVEIAWLRARVVRAEIDADRLAECLRVLCDEQFDQRYTRGHPLACCYDAVHTHGETVGLRLPVPLRMIPTVPEYQVLVNAWHVQTGQS
jgi:hypothetical protein